MNQTLVCPGIANYFLLASVLHVDLTPSTDPCPKSPFPLRSAARLSPLNVVLFPSTHVACSIESCQRLVSPTVAGGEDARD